MQVVLLCLYSSLAAAKMRLPPQFLIIIFALSAVVDAYAVPKGGKYLSSLTRSACEPTTQAGYSEGWPKGPRTLVLSVTRTDSQTHSLRELVHGSSGKSSLHDKRAQALIIAASAIRSCPRTRLHVGLTFDWKRA